MPFFSIIIPVYNGLSHGLPKCLESIFSAEAFGRGNLEVVCVDDCSTDGTREYLKTIERSHGITLVFNEYNLRQGGAKNIGIRVATGKYILFIDQDDYYHENSVDFAFEYLKKNMDLDVLVLDSAWQQLGTHSNRLQLNLPNKQKLSGREFINENGFVFAPWRMCCRREFLLSNSLYFQEHTRIEDIDWGVKVCLHAKLMQYQPILLVHYNRYSAQTTSLMSHDINVIHDQLWVALRLKEVADATVPESFSLERVVRHHYHVGLKAMCLCNCPIKDKVDCLRKFCRQAPPDNLVAFAGEHPLFYSITSVLIRPIFYFGISIINWWRWHTVWRVR